MATSANQKTVLPRCHEGIVRGDGVAAIQPLLSHHIPINMRDVDGNTALAVAAFCSNVSVLNTLLEHGAHVNSKDRHGETPLHKACRQGANDVVKQLLVHRADVNRQRNLDGQTPLMLACAHGYSSVVVTLLVAGADPSLTDMYDRRAMHWAIKSGSLESVCRLHEHGASLTGRDKFGKTPVLQAARCHQPTILHYLLEHGASLEGEDRLRRAVLQIIAARDSHRCVPILLQHGLSLETPNSRGRTALMESAFSGHLRTVQCLLEHSADPNNTEAGTGSSALVFAIQGRIATRARRYNKPWFDVVLALLHANVDMEVLTSCTVFWDRQMLNRHPQNALEIAAKAGHADTVKLLARAGSSPGNLSIYFNLPEKALPQAIRKNMQLFNWVRHFYKSPRPLVELCRSVYRRRVGKTAQVHELPCGLRNYLQLGDVDDLVEEHKMSSERVKVDLGELSEDEYEVSGYDSNWYGSLENIIDTESEGEEEEGRVVDQSGSLLNRSGVLIPGPSVW